MSWSGCVGDEIAEMFASYADCGVVDYADATGGWHEDQMLAQDVRLYALRKREQDDPAFAAKVARAKEHRRKERLSTDAEYAEKRQAQYRAAYERNRARYHSDAEYREKRKAQYRAAYERKKARAALRDA